MLRATETVRHWSGPFIDEVILDHEGRNRRRILLTGRSVAFLLDLPEVPDLREGDGICLPAGVVRVGAANEDLLEIRCADMRDLARAAWHLGNRHLSVEIRDGSLRVRSDHVIAEMLRGLGAEVRAVTAPFQPERGAYSERGHGNEAHHG